MLFWDTVPSSFRTVVLKVCLVFGDFRERAGDRDSWVLIQAELLSSFYVLYCSTDDCVCKRVLQQQWLQQQQQYIGLEILDLVIPNLGAHYEEKFYFPFSCLGFYAVSIKYNIC